MWTGITIGTSLAAVALAPGDTAAAQTAPVAPRAPQSMREVAPGLAAYTDNVLFGEVWERPGLAKRDRSLVTIASLIAGGRSAQLTSHLRIGLGNGLKPVEIAEILTHMGFYAGWPNAVSAVVVAQDVFKAQGVDTASLAVQEGGPLTAPASDAARAERVRATVAPTAPALADYTNRILFEDLWRRPALAARDRSLATIAALVTTGDVAQLEFHLRLGLENGLSPAELAEAFNHLAFYAGWPRAMGAVPVLARVTGPAESIPSPLTVVRAGTSPVAGPARNFTGSVQVDTSFRGAAPSRLGGARVTFQPGARTNWHSHALGQTLLIASGRGLVQDEGGAVREVRAGDIVVTAPGVRHWHGAARDSVMSHFAISERSGDADVIWMEPVSDAQYRGRAK